MVPQKQIKKERRIVIISIAVAILCVLYVLTYELYLWGENSNKNGLLWVFMKRYFILFSTYFMVFIEEMPYWNFIRLIRKRIEVLNEVLEKGLDLFRNFRKLWITPVKTKNTSGSFGSIFQISKYFKIIFLTVLSYEKVVNLMKIYELIGDSVDATNDFCGVSILVCTKFLYCKFLQNNFFQCIMFSCLLHLVVTPYFLLVEVANGGFFFFVFLQFSWTMLHCGRLLVIVETCQYCLDEVRNQEFLTKNNILEIFQHQRTVELVFKLLTCELQDEVKDQLKLFALQLSGRKVRFTSFSMMKFNRSLLTAVRYGKYRVFQDIQFLLSIL